MRQLRAALLIAVLCILAPRFAAPAFAQDEPPAPPPEPAPAPVEAPAPAEAPAAAEAPAPAEAPAAAPAEKPAPAEVPAPTPNASGGIVLNFKDASLDAVLNYLSEAAGFVVVSDVAMDGRVSVVSRQPLNADEAVELLNTVLKDKGYAALRAGRTLKIVPLSDAKKANVPVRSGNDPKAIEPSDRLVTQVIPLRFVDAVKLKQDIASLVPSYADLSANASSNALILTDTEANVRRIVEIVSALDTHLAAVADVKVFQLKYANATSAAKLINDIFKEETATQQQAGGPFGGFRRFQMPGGQPATSTEETPRSQKITAAADDRTNTVVVSGPPDVLKVVESVVHELDANPAAEQAVLTCRLKNAKAANLQKVLNSLFTTQQTTTGTTGARTQTTAAGGAAGRFGAQQLTPTVAAAAANLVGQVYVVADEDTNSLMVMAASKNFDTLRAIINELDKSVPQVLIKVLLAEVTHTDQSDMGTEFSILNLAGTLHSESDTAMVATLDASLSATLRAWEEAGKLDVLSRPYILASDNQAANITVGQRVPFITNTRTTETGQTINTIQYQDIGIILNVTPHINPEGLVILDVAPEISALTGDTVPISEAVDAPVFAKRSAKSRVAIHDGQTIVIGGLMEDKKTDNVHQVPLLGDIPILGALFRHTTTETTKTELLIFLTPHVAQEAGALQGMSEDEKAGSKIIEDAVSPGTFQEHLKGLERGAAAPQEKKDESTP